MKILFENSYTKDKKLLKEIYSYFCFKRPITLIIIIAILLLFIKNIFNLIIYGYTSFMAIYTSIFYFIFKIVYYNSIIKTQLKIDYELNNNKPLDVKTIVTDEKIQNIASNGAVNEITYEKIKKGFQTKNLILFISKANLIYIFRKDTFSKGNTDEFIIFMKNKGIKI